MHIIEPMYTVEAAKYEHGAHLVHLFKMSSMTCGNRGSIEGMTSGSGCRYTDFLYYMSSRIQVVNIHTDRKGVQTVQTC